MAALWRRVEQQFHSTDRPLHQITRKQEGSEGCVVLSGRRTHLELTSRLFVNIGRLPVSVRQSETLRVGSPPLPRHCHTMQNRPLLLPRQVIIHCCPNSCGCQLTGELLPANWPLILLRGPVLA